ncbi:MAG: hypothetical protein WC947_03715 [Elusimicrobiota bacterium]
MKQFLSIFNLKFAILKNRFIHSTKTNIIKFSILLLFIGIYCTSGQYFVLIFIEKLKDIPVLKELYISKLFISEMFLLLLSIFMPFLIFGGLVSFIPTFLNKKELTFNLINNYSLLPVFIYNYFEIIFKNWAFILISTAPVWIAYGKLFNTSYLYFILTPIIMLMYSITLVSIGTFIAFALMTLSPKLKIKIVINLASVVFILFMIYYITISHPVNLIGNNFVNELLNYTQQLKTSNLSLKIPEITNSILTGFVYKKNSIFFNNILKLLLSNGMVFVITITFCYYIFKKKILLIMDETGSNIFDLIKPSYEIKSQISKNLIKKYPLVYKEVIYIIRDSTLLPQILLIIILSIAFIIYTTKFKNVDTGTSLFYFTLSYPTLVFLLVMFAGRLVFPSVSTEGKNIWTIKLSPVGIKKFIYTKILIFFIFQLLFSIIFLLIIHLMYGYASYIQVILNFSIIISLGITVIGIVLGTILVDFYESDPWKIATGLGGVLFFIVSFSFSFFPILMAIRYYMPILYYDYAKRGINTNIIKFSYIYYPMFDLLFILPIILIVTNYLINKVTKRLEIIEI